MEPQETVFRKIRPLLITSLVNRAGSVGLMVLPILLVQRQFSPDVSALVMMGVKVGSLGGTFLGGWLTDRISLRGSLIVGFMASAVGLGFLPFALAPWALILAGLIAQAGYSMFPSSARMMITTLVKPSEQRESIGWLRTINNTGSLIAHAVSRIGASFGVAPIMIFDAITSLLAAIYAKQSLPATQLKSSAIPETPTAPLASTRLSEMKLALAAAGCVGIWTFLYEMFTVAAAARIEIQYPGEGIALFSQIMILNTILCAAAGVVATQIFSRANLALSLGLSMTILGCIITLVPAHPTYLVVFMGSAILTFGEIIFNSVGSFVVLRMIPKSNKQGSIYGTILILQTSLRIFGGAIAFPWIVHGSHPLAVILIAGGIGYLLWMYLRPHLVNIQ